MTTATTKATWALSVDPTSPSAMVSATHLVLVRLEALDVGKAIPGADGLWHREITIQVAAEDVYKGELSGPLGKSVRVVVRQDGLDLIGEGPPPILDPVSLRPGQRFFLDAVAPGQTNLGGLFDNQALRGIYPQDMARDAAFARDWEQAFAKSTPGDRALIEQLLKDAEANRATLHDRFAEYLWVRLSPVMSRNPQTLLPDVTKLALDVKSTAEFSLVLLAELDSLALDLDPDSNRLLMCAYVQALAEPLAPVIVDFVATQGLYNIVFDSDGDAIKVGVCGITNDAIARVRASLVQLGMERADKLVAWLSDR